jgi:sugar lactone lactonase YvrE
LNLSVNTYVGLVLDAAGDLFVSDTGNDRVRKVAAGGIITTVAGSGVAGFAGDGGPAVMADLDAPTGLALDAGGNLFIADEFNVRIRKITPQGIISTVAGIGKVGYSGDGGQATSAELSLITGIAVDSSENLYATDALSYRIRKIDASGIISTFGGNGLFRFTGDGGLAISASMNYPAGVAVDPLGNLYIADSYNDRVRKVSSGIISTAAGNGTVEYSGDGGQATQAGIFLPFGVAVDGSANLYIADTDDARIRKVTPSGIISTFAGNGIFGYSGDGGQATSAALDLPVGAAVDASGNLYIADNKNNRIRKVAPGGEITTVAGNGTAGFSGDGGAAISAELYLPTGVAVDASNNLFIADSGNDRVRKVTTDGKINTIAGNGSFGYSGDGGLATSAELNLNSGAAYDSLTVDTAGNLYIADYFNNRVRRVTPGGFISTVAGDGYSGYFGDGGLATNASLDLPAGVTLDGAGDLLIADTFNQRIRAVLVSAPSVTVSPQQLQFTAPSSGAPTAPQAISLTSPVGGLGFSQRVLASIGCHQRRLTAAHPSDRQPRESRAQYLQHHPHHHDSQCESADAVGEG